MSSALQRLNEHANTIEAALHGYIETQKGIPAPLWDSVRYSLYGGGKRIRPALTMEVCRMFGGEDAHAIPLACAVECVHTYSLIHDDLPCMDNDDMRRGKPTNHRVYGEDTALLAGDGLLTFAFELIATRSTTTRANTLSAITVLAQCAGFCGMVAGQQLDLNATRKKPDLETVYQTHCLKTAQLIRAACLLGCCAADVYDDPRKRNAIEEYAYHLGMAFQIMDDVLDYIEPREIMGEPFDDNDPTTVMHFMTTDEAKALAAEHTAKAIAAIEEFGRSEVLIGIAKRLARRTH